MADIWAISASRRCNRPLSGQPKNSFGVIQTASDRDVINELCSECGLCCNGVLFADVQLQPADSPTRLLALHLELHRRRNKAAFAQPCSCWAGNSCRIYSERPTQCRAFVCGTLKRVELRKLSTIRALVLIARAKKQVARIEKLFVRLGDSEAHLPLSKRYARIMAQPLDLGGDPNVLTLRSQLTAAMDRLMKTLDRNFRQ